ncbi:MAG: DUF1501 domain-containing protein [Planctomycetota bacterium]|nr:DUF1501 domain-containing protein [Planctomycetota bacterium]
MINDTQSRREFVGSVARTGLAAGVAGLSPRSGFAADATASNKLRGKADSCIFIWLGGGACQIDTWDPKRKGDAKSKKPGSYYDPIPTAIEGVQVCEHLSRMAKLLDRCALVRTVHHDVIDEHAAAVYRLHTGRPTSGTVVYPSIGSVAAHQLAARGESVPAYVIMGYPNLTRGPGFLGSKYGYLYLTNTSAGPTGLRRPPEVAPNRQARREQLLARLRKSYVGRTPGDRKIANYAAASAESLKLAGPEFMSVFDLKSESDTLRNSYGEEFGQRCLLARRLVESGVTFVEVAFNLNFINGTGWDTHNQGQLNQHILIDQLDQAMSALIADLEKRNRLDRTLIVVATEFGRPPEFDGGGGRGHHSKSFSIALAGGGLQTGQVIGATDDLGKSVVQRPVSVPALHATIYATLGIDPHKELFDGDRPVPITDGGKVIAELFS